MSFKVVFKNMDHIEDINDVLNQKTLKLNKLFDAPLTYLWSFEKRDKSFIAEAKCLGPTFEFHAENSGTDFYHNLDQTFTKLQKQMEKKHDKWKSHRGNIPADEAVEKSMVKREKALKAKAKAKKSK